SQWLSGKYLYFGYPKIGAVTLSAVPWAILVGVVCGILAYPFQRLLKVNWRNKLPHYFNRRLQMSLLVGLFMAALANFVNPDSIGGGVAVVEDVLLDGEKASLSLFFARFLGTIASNLSGCAGGFLAPSLALGATIGSLVSTWVHYANHNLMVLVGMAAFLSAVVRAPFTAWVIVMEMTDRHQAIFPLMVASLLSHATLGFLMGDKKRN
ncbi:MAG: chloride channel protein, partial [Deltaproteobacteria bacterium]